LPRPVYPPIAVSAAISGDVEVKVGVRPDGSVESMAIVSGHPLLQQAALEAAQRSRFECRGCIEATSSYSVVFSFRFADASRSAFDTTQPEAISIGPSQSRVTVVAEMPLAIPYFSYVQIRSAKCLYLWRCGSRWGGYEYYYARVRSARCLWLWKCGFSRLGASGE
jgi:TonB family protein